MSSLSFHNFLQDVYAWDIDIYVLFTIWVVTYYRDLKTGNGGTI